MTEHRKIIAQNRRARFDYIIDSTIEAGLVLHGSEVKSLRKGSANIRDAFAAEMEGTLCLVNSYIAEYEGANRFNHESRRPRKLLLHKREMHKLMGSIQRKGYTLVPIALYFNEKGRAKVELGLGKGKDKADRRQTIKDRDWKREKSRVLKNQN